MEDMVPDNFVQGMVAGGALLGFTGRLLLRRPWWHINIGATAVVIVAVAVPAAFKLELSVLSGPLPFLLFLTLFCISLPASAAAALDQLIIVRRG